MRNLSIKTAAWLCPALLALSSCEDLYSLLQPVDSELERLSTPAWIKLRWSDRPYSLVASRTPSSSIYFARRRPISEQFASPIYDYDTVARKISQRPLPRESSDLEWRVVLQAGIGRHLISGNRCRYEDREGVRVGSACVLAKGKNVAAMGKSDSGKYIYMVSADGPHKVNGPNIWGEGGEVMASYGQHYLELISVELAKVVGHPILIGIKTAQEPYLIDWINDDTRLAIAPLLGHWLAVIEVEDFMK